MIPRTEPLLLTLASIAIALLPRAAEAQLPASLTIDGSTVGALFGTSVSGIGDVDGDGTADFVVGAPYSSLGGLSAGSARVHSGATGAMIHGINGLAGENLGAAVAGVGDLNGDGVPDFAVGSPGVGGAGGFANGLARVYSGVDATPFLTLSGPALAAGSAVSAAGDADGDGVGDVIVGAPGGFAFLGLLPTARIHSGVTGAITKTLTGEQIDEAFGAAVAGVGDVNGDGFDDVIVGAPGHDIGALADAGRARVFSGFDGSVLMTIDGAAAGERMGSSVAGAGDVNRDGIPDVLVGAPGADPNGAGSGRAVVHSGHDGSLLHEFWGDSQGDAFGFSVAGLGDVDGDGHDDLGIAAPSDGDGGPFAGSVLVVSGRDGTTLHDMDGPASAGEFGTGLASAGDVNGDGFADFLVGAPREDTILADAGRVRLYVAPTLPVLVYDSSVASPSPLALSWSPAAGDPFSTTGDALCTGSTPFAFGAAVASLGGTDELLFGTLPLLVDPSALLLIAPIAFDATGAFPVLGFSRQDPPLAGQRLHVQFFELEPTLRPSNGLRLELVP